MAELKYMTFILNKFSKEKNINEFRKIIYLNPYIKIINILIF